MINFIADLLNFAGQIACRASVEKLIRFQKLVALTRKNGTLSFRILYVVLQTLTRLDDFVCVTPLLQIELLHKRKK